MYLAVSSCICCIPLYLTVSHRLENGIWPKLHSRGGRLAVRELGGIVRRQQLVARPDVGHGGDVEARHLIFIAVGAVRAVGLLKY